jgi:uncharacterized protein (TIGR03382 family)
MKSAFLRPGIGCSAALVIITLARAAIADIGPIEPARQICMGSAAGAPCEIDGKKGTCQGPHPSRMYCTVAAEPAPAPSPDKQPVTDSPPVSPPPTKATQKGSCAATSPEGLLLPWFAGALLLLGRRRRTPVAR